MLVQEKILKVERSLRRNLRIHLVLIFIFQVSILTGITLLFGLWLGLMSWLVGVVAFLASSAASARHYLRALRDRHYASLIIDERLGTAERAISFAEIHDELAKEPRDAAALQAKSDLLEQQLGTLLADDKLDEITRFKLTPLERRIGWSLPLLWALIGYLIWSGYSDQPPSIHVGPIAAIDELLEKHEDLPEPVKEAFEDLKQTLSQEPPESEKITEAIAIAAEVLQSAQVKLAEYDVVGESAESSAGTSEPSGKKAVLPTPTATATATPSPTPSASSQETPPSSSETDPSDQGEREGSQDSEERSETAAEGEHKEGSSQTDVQNSKPSDAKKSGESKQSESGDGSQGGGEGANPSQSGGSKQGAEGSGGNQGADPKASEGKGETEGAGGKSDSSKQSKSPSESGEKGEGSKEGGQQGESSESSQGGSQGADNQQAGLEAAGEALDQIQKELGAQKGTSQSSGAQEGEPSDTAGDRNSTGNSGGEPSEQQQRTPQEQQAQGSQGSSPSSREAGSEKQSGSDPRQGESDRSTSSGSSSNAGQMPDRKNEDSKTGEPVKRPPVSENPPTQWEVKEGEFGPGEGQRLGGEKGYKEIAVGENDEKVDSSHTGSSGELRTHSGEVRSRTALSDVQLAKPEAQHDRAAQEIPLEYKELLK